MKVNVYSLFLSALATLAIAQNPNSFNIPPQGYLLHAGQSTTFTWSNLQGSTVTLTLREGANGNLNQGTVIASGLKNAGSFTWNVPSDTVQGNSYTLEITDEQDTSVTNFTPQFDILSNVLASSSPAPSSSAAPTTSAAPSSSLSPSTSAPATTQSPSTSATATASASTVIFTTLSTSSSASGSSNSTGSATLGSASSTAGSTASSTSGAPVTVASSGSVRTAVAGAGAGLIAVAGAFVAAF